MKPRHWRDFLYRALTVVTPAKAGACCVLFNFETGWNAMDTGLRRYDEAFVGPDLAVDVFWWWGGNKNPWF